MERTAVVRIDTVYQDGSGAPAVVEIDGRVFAADFLGGARLKLRSGRPSHRLFLAATRAYVAAVYGNTDAAWRSRNSAMYSKEGA